MLKAGEVQSDKYDGYVEALLPPLTLVEVISAEVLTLCLIIFFSVNMWNLWRFRGERRAKRCYAEHPPPRGLPSWAAAFGTLAFWGETLFYIVLVFSGCIRWVNATPLRFRFLCDFAFRWLGLFLMVLGFVLFGWSVLARGRYAVSWEMPEDQRLVTWGPYRFVRHPSYLSYFLMFVGLFLLWLNLLAVIPLLAIPGYVHVAKEEEKLLIKRFGEEYAQYQRKTGRFLPKLRK